MDAEKRFSNLRDFLREHQYLHSTEAMDRYGSEVPAAYAAWAQELCGLSWQELIEIENAEAIPGTLSAPLRTYLNDCQRIVQVPQLKISLGDFHPFLKRKLIPKKEHELRWLVGLLRSSPLHHFIDVGSGAGHLSSCLLDAIPNATAVSIDANAEFQSIGKNKLGKWRPELLARLQFIQSSVDQNFTLPAVPERTGIIGLHSCGDLSVHVLKLFATTPSMGLVNFGCCYHKCNGHYNLSPQARSQALWFTDHALTLAAKSYAWQTERKLQEKLRVKTLRYGLHFYCMDHFGSAPASIGNTSKVDTALPLSQFLRTYLPQEYAEKITKDADEYLASEKFQSAFKFTLCLGLLRALLGRAIELYLVLDRVLWLRSLGKDVELYECFDRRLSPRNLGIIKI